jgi:hypothetical protein
MTHTRVTKGSSRWYRIIDDRVERCTLPPEVPNPDPSWIRGLGPRDADRANYLTSIRFKGIPKSPQQRELMRQAKLGVPKSAEHRENMSRAHIERHNNIRAIMRELAISWSEARNELRRRRDQQS